MLSLCKVGVEVLLDEHTYPLLKESAHIALQSTIIIDISTWRLQLLSFLINSLAVAVVWSIGRHTGKADKQLPNYNSESCHERSRANRLVR